MSSTRTNTAVLALCLLWAASLAEEMRFSYDLGSNQNICFNENAAASTSSKLNWLYPANTCAL